jgi:nucleoside-diphosphate kinase
VELTKLTFAMIKPDAVEAKNSGKIIDMIEHNGFEIVRLQKVIIAAELAEEFYAEHKERPFFGELVEFVTSAPVIILALHKDNAIASWRELIGVTDSKKAAPGTVRNMYGTDLGKNAVHGSADSASALQELELFFPDLFGYDSDENSDGDDNCAKDECSDEDECCNGE